MRRKNLTERVDACKARLRRTQVARISGTVTHLLGLVVEVEGLDGLAGIGDRLSLQERDGRTIPAEVIGFRNGAVQAMAYGSLDGLAHGAKAVLLGASFGMLDVAASWLGRVIDPLGNPLDHAGVRADPESDKAGGAGGHFARASGAADRSGGAGAELLCNLPAGSAAGAVRRIGGWQVDVAVNADAGDRVRRRGAGAGG
jgi:F0F1-type ATP synthase alpha subunit